MKVKALDSHYNLFELRNKGYLRAIKLLSDDVQTSMESFVLVHDDLYEIIISEVKGMQYNITLNYDELYKLYSTVRKMDYHKELIPYKQLTDEIKPNTIHLITDDDGIEIINPATLNLEYEYLEDKLNVLKSTLIGDFILTVNGDHLILLCAENKEVIVFDSLSIVSALMTIQAKYGFPRLSMRSMSFQLLNLKREYDLDVVSYGTSYIFYANNLIWSVQEDLISLANLSLSMPKDSLLCLSNMLQDPTTDLHTYKNIELDFFGEGKLNVLFRHKEDSNKDVLIPVSASVDDHNKLLLTERNIRVISTKAWSFEPSLMQDKRVLVKQKEVLVMEV